MQTPPPLHPNKAPPDWWSRNWKWVVPAILFVVASFFCGFIALVFGFMRSSGAYIEAVARVKSDPAVIEKLGTPIEAGYFFTGSVNINNSSGNADLAIPVEGPKDKATVYVVATRSQGEWHFDTLVVKVDGAHERIDLLSQSTNNALESMPKPDEP